jgi:uncharacterized protein
MSAYTYIILVLIGLIAGIIAGMFGIGGGLIIVPALIYFAGFREHEAIGTSLAVLLPPIGLFAAYNYYTKGYVNLKYALIIAATFMIASYFSSKLTISLPENMVRKLFSIFLVLVAIKMWFSK